MSNLNCSKVFQNAFFFKVVESDNDNATSTTLLPAKKNGNTLTYNPHFNFFLTLYTRNAVIIVQNSPFPPELIYHILTVMLIK